MALESHSEDAEVVKQARSALGILGAKKNAANTFVIKWVSKKAYGVQVSLQNTDKLIWNSKSIIIIVSFSDIKR